CIGGIFQPPICHIMPQQHVFVNSHFFICHFPVCSKEFCSSVLPVDDGTSETSPNGCLWRVGRWAQIDVRPSVSSAICFPISNDSFSHLQKFRVAFIS